MRHLPGHPGLPGLDQRPATGPTTTRCDRRTASDNSITAAALWDGLTARALLGVEGTAEIDWITNGHNEGN